MKKKIVYSMTLGLAVSAASVFAAEELASTSTGATVSTEQIEALPEGPSVLERLAALEANAKKSSWADDIKFKGDLRFRYENRKSETPDSDPLDTSDKSRERIRARIGAYGAVNDNVDFGVRIATGDKSTPTSTNQDLDNYAEKKQIWLDLAYMTITCPLTGVELTFGKMKQPWVTVSDLVYDSDVNPEGISAGYDFDLEGVEVMTELGHFILEENGGADVQMSSGQIAAKTKVSEDVSVTAGANLYVWINEQLAAVGKGNSGAVDFSIAEAFAQADFTSLPVPVKLFGDYVQNVNDDINDDTAWMVGVGTKLGKASFDYNYRVVEPDAIYGGWADSDFHDGGTGGKGHKISAKYELMKHLSAGATYFLAETEEGNDVNTLQLDLVAKF